MPKENVVYAFKGVSGNECRVVDVDYSDLTWKIDVFYKNQVVSSWNRDEFFEFDSMFAAVAQMYELKYNQKFSSTQCKKNYPFEVNVHHYASRKLESLLHILENQYNDDLQEYVKKTEEYEQDEFDVLAQAHGQPKVDEYYNSLTEDDVLIFRINELKIDKKIELKLVTAISEMKDSYISELQAGDKEDIEISIKQNVQPSKVYAKKLERASQFYKKFDVLIDTLNMLRL